MKLLKVFLFSFVFIAFLAFCPKVSPAYAAELHLSNDRVALDASDFSITTNGKTFVGENISLHSDPGTPTYTTLEASWHEQDVEMRLQMYFYVTNGVWRVSEIRTYNGQPNGDWLQYYGFTGGPLGSTYTTGSLDLSSYAGFSGGSGVLHFSNLSVKPNFISPDEGVVVWNPNGGQSFTPSTMVQIDWRLNQSGITDTNQTFKTSIYLQKADGTTVQTIVNNQNITRIGSSHYDWMVPAYGGNDYKIAVVLSDLNLSDKSDTVFTIVAPTTAPTASSPTQAPTSASSTNANTQSSGTTPTTQPTGQTLGTTVAPAAAEKNKETKDTKGNKKSEGKNKSSEKKPEGKSHGLFGQFVAWFQLFFRFGHK